MFMEQPSISDGYAWNSVEIIIQDSKHMDKCCIWEESAQLLSGFVSLLELTEGVSEHTQTQI